MYNLVYRVNFVLKASFSAGNVRQTAISFYNLAVCEKIIRNPLNFMLLM